MTEDIRAFLYSLGFLSSIAFGARFLVQWIESERRKKSVVPPFFWRLSLIGNLLLLTHSFIQIQAHVFLIQIGNAVISWRNLNLMKSKERQFTFSQTVQLMIVSLVLGTSLYFAQYIFIESQEVSFFRIPLTPWNHHHSNQISLMWHLLGVIGLVLFNSRFWVQWWCAEKEKKSYLGFSFWWVSLVGDALCLAYFAQLGDPVNLVGPLFGLIPYIRNILLLRKNIQSQETI